MPDWLQRMRRERGMPWVPKHLLEATPVPSPEEVPLSMQPEWPPAS